MLLCILRNFLQLCNRNARRTFSSRRLQAAVILAKTILVSSQFNARFLFGIFWHSFVWRNLLCCYLFQCLIILIPWQYGKFYFMEDVLPLQLVSLDSVTLTPKMMLIILNPIMLPLINFRQYFPHLTSLALVNYLLYFNGLLFFK